MTMRASRTQLQSLFSRTKLVNAVPKRDDPKPISAAQHRALVRRASRIARGLGFIGGIEYRHVHSRSGGAQYCIGPSAVDDLLVLYAEAFERDADPDDFSLEALIAHECGRQRLIRNAGLRSVLAKFPGERLEEVLASLVGSLLLGESEAAQTLVWKATAELGELGMSAESTVHFIERMRLLLRHFL
jgi:hypothetical protein